MFCLINQTTELKYLCRNLQSDIQNFEASAKKRADDRQTVLQPGLDQDPVCDVCHKTKFADGFGNQCHYCGLRSCARCGGKIQLHNSKVSSTEMAVVDSKCAVESACCECK